MACFADSLRTATKNDVSGRYKLIKELAVGLGLPFALSILAAYFLDFIQDDSWHVAKELIFLNVLKLASIGTLSFHTNAAAEQIPIEDGQPGTNFNPVNIYRYISLYMMIVVAALAVHTTMLLCVPSPYPCSNNFLLEISPWINSMFVLYSMTIFSFLYMFWFIYGNWRFQKMNPNNPGVERFAQAFILGVNIPSIIGFLAAFFISLIFYKSLSTIFAKPETFFEGAVALLIYSSSAASICVDHYARPFLVAARVWRSDNGGGCSGGETGSSKSKVT